MTNPPESLETEAAVPPPPPARIGDNKSSNYDPLTNALEYELWDFMLVYGPLDIPGIHQQRPSFPAGAFREYVEYHPGHANLTPSESTVWQSWALTEALKNGVDRGWFTLTDGKYAYADVPPEHTPLASYGGKSGLEHRLRSKSIGASLEVLRTKNSRRKPDPKRLEELKQSINNVGVIHDIIVWSWSQIGSPTVQYVLDGQTRLDIIEELGITLPKDRIKGAPGGVIRDVTGIDPHHALMIRVESELIPTTKPEFRGDGGRNSYLLALHDLGWKRQSLTEEFGITKGQIRKILKEAGRASQKISPTEDEIQRMHDLKAAGWTQREIASPRGVGFGIGTVNKYLKQDHVRSVHPMHTSNTDGQGAVIPFPNRSPESGAESTAAQSRPEESTTTQSQQQADRPVPAPTPASTLRCYACQWGWPKAGESSPDPWRLGLGYYPMRAKSSSNSFDGRPVYPDGPVFHKKCLDITVYRVLSELREMIYPNYVPSAEGDLPAE